MGELVRVDRMNRIIRLILIAIRLLTPWMLRFIWWGIVFAVMALRAILSGILPTVRRIAEIWTDRAIRSGLFTIYDRIIYTIACVVAFGCIIVGWVILSFITTWVVGVIL